MANHRGAAALLLIASSLLVAVALSGVADARPTNTVVTVRRDANGPGHVAVAAAQAMAEPECEEEEEPQKNKHHGQHDGENGEAPTTQPGYHGNNGETTQPAGGADGPSPLDGGNVYSQLNSEEAAQGQELCSDCEEPPPPCETCESEPELTCKEVRAVREGETCESVVKCAGLGQDDFLRFNPNLCCDKLFVGQWICLEATCAA